MVKKGKKVWTAVVTVLFVLSVGYFALLAPTTAWFYESYGTSYPYRFGDFGVNYSDPTAGQEEEPFSETVDVTLRAATRFADKGETLFGEVVHTVKVESANDGSVPADVAVTVAKPDANSDPLPDWLHYYVCALNKGTTITSSTFKSQIDAMLDGATVQENSTTEASTLTQLDYKNLTRDASPANAGRDNAETAYEAYNTKALKVLNTHNAQKINFTPGSEKDIYIVFWAEYGQMTSGFRGMGSVQTLGSYAVKITMRAEPFVPDTQVLRLVNNSASTANLAVYFHDSNASGNTVYNNSVIANLAANDTRNIDIEVGQPYNVVLSNASSSMKILAGTDSNGAPIYASQVNGVIGNQVITVTVVTPQTGS